MERVTGKGVTAQQNFDNGRYSSVNAGAQGLGSTNQRFYYDPSSSINTNIRPPDVGVQFITRPVQNFSIQTGEEFAFEFMRDRVNPRPQLIQTVSGSDHVGATSYIDSNGMLVLPSSLSESVPEVAMITPGNSEIPAHDRNHFSANGPVPSITQTSGGITGFARVLRHETSDMSDTSVSKMKDMSDTSVLKLKFLCSFGGRILPRPSDGKLRYVGGETRVMRISKDASWEELLQKAMSFYSETLAIKYQLPGEDLDALVSISCDEDLHNMMEECNLFEEGVLQKLRIFLLSALDLDNSEIGSGNMEGDCEVQYVVAVNGMDFGSRRNSIVLGSTSGNLDELLSLGDDIASTSKSSQFVAAQSSLQLSSETNPLYRDIERRIDEKRTNHNDYEQISEKDASEKDKKMNRENSSQKLNDFEKVQSSGTKKVTSLNPYDAHVSSLISKDEASSVDADSIGEVGVYPIDSSNEPPTFPQNMFHSERLPRELSGLNRLSKSDDSSGAQFLVAHAHSDVSQQISEALHQVVESDETGLDFVQTRDGLRVSPQTLEISPSGKILQSNMPTRGDKLKGLPKEGYVINTGNSEIRDLPHENETSGSSLLTPSDVIRENVQDESVSKVVRRVPLGEVPAKQADISTKKVQIQPSSGREYSVSGVSENKSSANVAVAEGQDILIDINDRFPPDFLSDIFSKAKVLDGTERQSDDTGLSLNVENHEPKHWSYFQKLAQEEDFVRKDVSLMDLDHLGFSSHANAEETTPLEYGLANLKEDRTAMDQIDSAGDFTSTIQRKTPCFSGPNIVNISSDYNPQTTDTENVHIDDATKLSGKPDADYEDEVTEGETTAFPLIDLTIADFDPSSLQIIMNEDLEEFRELGSGTFGTVYYGQWRGTDVAIKRIKKLCFTGRSSEQERLRVEFWREAEILSRLHHPNVVAFYGVVQDGPGGTLATVAEFMVNGSLRHVLLSKDRHLDRRKRLVIAMDAAFGMEYLHSKSIVHFDLKCDNLLVNLKDPSRPICKVADFGLSKIKRSTLVTGGVRGTLPWMAPELLNGGSSKVSEKVDVFSFGIVLWEILTGEEPYSNMHYGAIIGGIVNNTLRPQIPSNCDPDWKLLMEQCWAPDPSVRPSFTEIARRLRLMLSVSPSQGRPQGTAKQSQVSK